MAGIAIGALPWVPHSPLAVSAAIVAGCSALVLLARRPRPGSNPQLLAVVSHELRTPLNSIINVPEGMLERFRRLPTAECSACRGCFSLDRDETVERSTQCPACGKVGTLEAKSEWRFAGEMVEVVDDLGRIVRSARRMLAVVNDVLDFSKLEAGKMPLHVAEISIGQLVRDMIELVEPIARQKNVRFKVQTPAEERKLQADGVKLGQVFMNLLSNAVKFSPEGSEVSVSYVFVAGACRISVQDQGPGIAPEHHEAIFESFRQIESGKSHPGGTGLGLAISRRYVELHGGNISLESTQGRGSQFTVTLPLDSQLLTHASLKRMTS